MKYLNFVAASGRPAREDLTVMQREIPGWEKETQGVRLLGRALDLPHTASTVRVRDSQPLVTDGPFVEAKEFIAGFDLLECTDLDECIAVAATAPLARFMAIEIRPFASEPRLDEKAAAFGRFQDGGEGDDPGEDPDGEQVLDEPDSGPRPDPGDRERPLEQRPVGLDDGQQQDDEAPERGRVRGPGMLHFSSFRCPITSVSCAFRSPGTWSCAYATRSGPAGR